MLKSALLALILAAVAAAQAPTTAPSKGSVSGNVTSAAGEPLKSAKLTLQEQPAARPIAAAGLPTLPQAYSASSDAQGNFTFDGLSPGRYTLRAERSGYLQALYSANPGSGPISVLELTSGQKLSGIAIKMTPQAVISGRVTDEDGDPYPRARISVARWTWAGGQKRLAQSGSVTSDAEGAFSVGNLAAGSYYISAAPQQTGVANAVQKGAEEVYMTTYYPSVTNSVSAAAVQVTAGTTARGTEIRMRKARGYRIRGKVVDPARGDAPPIGTLRLTPKDGLNLPGLSPPVLVRNGIFDIGGVLPGVYILEAPPLTSTSADGTRTTQSGMARQIITVGNEDVEDLVVQLRPGAEITGKISIDGAAPQQQQQQPGTPGINARPTVRLIAAEGQISGSSQQAGDDGTFAIHNIMPAVYRVEVLPVPQGTYVKSIRFGSQDLMKTPLDLTSGSGGTLNVVLSPNAGDISGIVHGSDGMPVASVMVTLWTPGVPAEGVTDFTRSAQTDTNGQFKFASLPPGDYRIAAWEQIDSGLGTVPEFRIQFESKAAAVKLNENAHENVEAPLIGRDAIQTEAAKLQ